MSTYTIEAEVREARGKEKNKKIRRAGRLPAIAYGKGEPTALTVDDHDFGVLLQRIGGEKVLVDLNYDGKSEKVFLRDVQRDPVKDLPIHVDFFRVDMDHEMQTEIQVVQHGTPIGLKEGGILEHGVRTVSVKAKPQDIPPHLEVDVSHLKVNESVHISDLPAIPGLEILTAGDTTLFAVVPKATVVETEETEEGLEGEEPKEPELIGKKGEDEDE